MRRALIVVLMAVPTVWALAEIQQAAPPPSSVPVGAQLSDPFAVGWFVADTNGDGIADAVTGKIVLPENPTAAENAAAANLAARVAYSSTGLTLPLVVTPRGLSGDGPRVWVGRAAPGAAASESTAPLQGNWPMERVECLPSAKTSQSLATMPGWEPQQMNFQRERRISRECRGTNSPLSRMR